jgi:proteasome lid subunit RPN8/RPN11
MPNLDRVVIDTSLLAGFKARALRAYPLEYGEDMWGFIEGTTAYITTLDRVEAEADEDSIEMESVGTYGEVVVDQTLLGTIHTHPDDMCIPSETDIEQAQEPPAEIVMGICAINKVPKRRYVSFGFFLPTGEQIELAVAENEPRPRKRGSMADKKEEKKPEPKKESTLDKIEEKVKKDAEEAFEGLGNAIGESMCNR